MTRLVSFEFFPWQLESLRLFVYRKVREVHELVFHVGWLGPLVIVGAEASNAFIAQVHLERVDAPNQQVQPHIEFLVIDKQWILDVSLQEVLVFMGSLGQLIISLQQFYSSACLALARFGDEGLLFVLGYAILEFLNFLGQQEVVWKEVEVVGEEPL